MTKLITANDAFLAIQQGKNVLCKHYQSPDDFEELGNFSATVFFTDDHEFCLIPSIHKIGGLALNIFEGVQSLSELSKNQIVYMPNLLALEAPIELQNTDGNSEALEHLINAKMLYDNKEHAVLHAQSLVEISKCNKVFSDDSQILLELSEPDSKKRRNRKKENIEIIVQEAPKDNPPKISLESELQLYLDGLRSCNNATEVESTLYEVDKVGFNAEQMLEITMLKEKKLADFKPKPKPSFEDLAEKEYQRVLNELLEAAKKASTPKEANALYKYTSHWTEEQRKPLIDAVHQRLAELNPPEKSQSSLMVRIQESTNLIELAKLEEEISKCDPAIQERLTSYANQRRTYLFDSVELPWETT